MPAGDENRRSTHGKLCLQDNFLKHNVLSAGVSVLVVDISLSVSNPAMLLSSSVVFEVQCMPSSFPRGLHIAVLLVATL